jgi:hypothetical protein
MPSFLGVEMMLIPFFPDLAQHIVGGCGRQRLPGAEDPDTLLFGQGRGSANRTQGNFLTGAFQFQRITRSQVQFIP